MIGPTNGNEPPQGPPKAMVPLMAMPVPQAFAVDPGEINGTPMVMVRIESPLSTTLLTLDRNAAQILAKALMECAGGLQIVTDPAAVQGIIRPDFPHN